MHFVFDFSRLMGWRLASLTIRPTDFDRRFRDQNEVGLEKEKYSENLNEKLN
jgi:hypothetical protein